MNYTKKCKLKTAPILSQQYNIILTTHGIPETFTQAHATLIYKNGNPQNHNHGVV